MLLATDLAAAREFCHGKLGLQIDGENENAIVFRCGNRTHMDVTDLHDYGGLHGRLVDVEEARAAVAAGR